MSESKIMAPVKDATCVVELTNFRYEHSHVEEVRGLDGDTDKGKSKQETRGQQTIDAVQYDTAISGPTVLHRVKKYGDSPICTEVCFIKIL